MATPTFQVLANLIAETLDCLLDQHPHVEENGYGPTNVTDPAVYSDTASFDVKMGDQTVRVLVLDPKRM